eukprot:1607980-Pyramimonas_sp.AAC.1
MVTPTMWFARAALRRMLIFSIFHGSAIPTKMGAGRCSAALRSRGVFLMFLHPHGSGLEVCSLRQCCHHHLHVMTVKFGELYTEMQCCDGRCVFGWGLSKIRPNMIDLVVYGPLPGPIQTSSPVELFAVVQILRVAVLPLRVITDYLDLPQGLDRGPAWGCHPRRPDADS